LLIRDTDWLPLTSRQTGVHLAHQVDPARTDYQIAEYIEICGSIDPALLESAVRSVIGETDSLQVRFEERDGVAGQVPRVLPVEFTVVDLTGRSDAVEIALERMRTRVAEPIDLSRTTIMDGLLFRVRPETWFWFWGIHHIVADGMSGALLARRVAEVYTALAGGVPVGPNVSTSLAEMLDEDLAYLSSDDFAADRTYWNGVVSSLPDPVGLLKATGRVTRCGGPLDPVVVGGLGVVGRRARTSWPVVVIAAVAAYLHRLSGAEDLVVGVPVTGRGTPAARRARGMFSVVVPLRLHVRSGQTIAELVRSAALALREALRHQRFPIDRITGSAPPWSAVVNAMTFDYDLDFGGVRATAHNLSGGGPVDCLSVNVFDRRNGEPVTVQFEVDGDPGELASHQRRFAEFLVRVAACEDRTTVGDVELLASGEGEWLARNGDGGSAPIPDLCLHELFEEQVVLRPDALAVCCGDEELSYRELNGLANELAWRVRAMIEPGDPVGLCVDRSASMVVAMLAVLKAGGCYVPLVPGLSREKLLHLVGNLALEVAVVDGHAPALPLRLVPVPGHHTAVENPPRRTDPTAAAYVLHTSGSTGRPKAVAIPHSAAVNFTVQNLVACGLGPGTRFLGYSAITFDMSVLEVFGALSSGGTLVLATQDERMDVDLLQQLIIRREAAVADLPPVLLPLLDPDALPSLTFLTVGGEAPSRDVVDRWTTPTRQVWNTYGPTETTVVVTMHRCTPDGGGAAPPMGRPTTNHRVHVVDAALRLLPPGAAGELCVSGAGLAKGYLGSPELTADSFVADPWAADPGDRMYRTGDLVRWTPDGELEFLGRIDHQVKVNGHRVEPGEIEVELRRCPGIAQAVVLLRDRVLTAYVVPETGARPEFAEVRARLAEALPRHMVPSRCVVLDELPLTAHGKVDRGALPDPGGPAVTSGRPGTERERLLTSLLEQVLGRRAPGVEEDLFASGADSITALGLVSAARAAGFAITVADVFAHPTIADLARTLPGPATPGIPESWPRHGAVPPTPMSEWLRLRGGPTNLLAQAAVLFTPSDLILDDLVAALRTLVDHHDALRLRTSGDGSCSITPPASVDVAALVRRVPADTDLDAVVATETRQALQRLDTGCGTVLQAVWLDRGAHERGRLVLVLHHLVVDGVSWRTLLADLPAAWRGARSGRIAALPPAGTPFAVWAERAGQLALAQDVVAELPAWRDVLEPGGRPFDEVSSVRGDTGRLQVELPSDVVEPLLSRVCAALGTGPTELMLAALQQAVARWERERAGRTSDAFLVDLESHGRDDARTGLDVTGTVGWFTAQFPLRIDAPATGSHADSALRRLVRCVHEALRALPSRTGFGLLRYLNPATGPELGRAGTPQVLFNYLGRFETGGGDWTPAPEGDPLTALADPESPRDHVLEINALVRDHGTGADLTALWTWSGPALTEADVVLMAGWWSSALRSMARLAPEENR
jgi:amino acid adenylation domain-containing protein/non-ribosomal peptide synthase protein (TIGR01720 family)